MNRRILLIDDTPAIHEDFRKILGGGGEDAFDAIEEALFGETNERKTIAFEHDSAYQGPEGLDKVREALANDRPYAMAFVDMRMPPGWDGCETIRRIWDVDPNLQIVVCTAYSDCSWEQVLAQLDVRDRLLILKKPFDSIEAYQLASALTTKWEMTRQAAQKFAQLEREVESRTLEIQIKSAALLAANERLSHAMQKLAAFAATDGLTGLVNRGAFDESFTHEFNRAVADNTELTVILLDIDRFKLRNDTFGHLAGDEVLRRIGAVLRREARQFDMVARYGGEEFVVLLQGLSPAQAHRIAERIRAAIATEPFDFEPVTASLGVASLSPSHNSPQSLIAEADSALYRSKEAGRNRVTSSQELTPI